jgi:glycosyltransferase involved in cell wall biosynthesis
MMSGLKGKEYAPVSVIIPCYRCWNTIERAVASVAAQTWQPAELILVDDASDDDTPKVLYNLQKHYGEEWIKLILREENGGPGAARNNGWDSATQPYVAFLDADDAWHPCKIEIQLKYMLAHPEVAITGHRWRFLREGEPLPSLPKHWAIRQISWWQMLISNRLSTPTVMLKRDLKFRFDPTKRYSEDYLLWLQIIYNGFKAVFIDLDLAYIYKAPYGVGGLSGQLWAMEKGELDVYWKLWRRKNISFVLLLCLIPFSLSKYVLRLIRSRLWR